MAMFAWSLTVQGHEGYVKDIFIADQFEARPEDQKI
jgi:hypothetical protein